MEFTKEKLVSIIMPCHNGAPYIAEAIRSVQNQTYSDWELLVIDDCSSDDSVQIINTFAQSDSRIRLLHTSRSTGYPASVRNVGIQAAAGRYIAFLDCDDFWLPDKLEHQLPVFEKENVAVVFSWYLKMDQDGNRHQVPVISPSSVNYKKLLNGNVIGNLTGIYDVLKVGKVLQKQVHHEDYLMWLEILKNDLIALNTNSVEAVYRVQKNSVSGKKIKSFIWTWQIFYREIKMPWIKAVKCLLCYTISGVVKSFK